MKHLTDENLEKYCENHTTAESLLFQSLVEETYKKTSIPQMQVGHLEGSFLSMLVKLTQAKNVLEIGTFTGYSALAMAQGLPPMGKLITCHIDDQVTNIAKQYWAAHKAEPKGE